eukprot:COSAG01_NODE_1546_length_9957_cov_20.812741_8_plen_107_part_00
MGISAAAVAGVGAAFGGIMYSKGAYTRGRRYSTQSNDPRRTLLEGERGATDRQTDTDCMPPPPPRPALTELLTDQLRVRTGGESGPGGIMCPRGWSVSDTFEFDAA